MDSIYRSIVLGLAAFCVAGGITVVRPAVAAQEHVAARIIYVIDGDTFRARVFAEPQFDTNIRVARIDTPEKGRGSQCDAERQAAKVASSFAKALLARGSTVYLSEIRPGKYQGRHIADVRLADGRDYGSLMLANGHAISYFGGYKRKIWCGADR